MFQVRGKVWLEAGGRFALGNGGVRSLSEIKDDRCPDDAARPR